MDLDLPETSVFAPRIPSLITPVTKYAAPYSSQKSVSTSKLQYVMTKSAPTLISPCTDCKLVIGANGYAAFMSGDRDCTIYCIRNPQLWLPKLLKEGVTHVKISPYYATIDNDPAGIPVKDAIPIVANTISKWFTDEIKDISTYLNRDRELIKFIGDMKNTKQYPTFYDVPLPMSDQYIIVGDKMTFQIPAANGLYFLTFDFMRLPNNQVDVSCTFYVAGTAMKRLLDFRISLFRI